MKRPWQWWWFVNSLLVKSGAAPTGLLDWIERSDIVTFNDSGVTVIPRR